MSSINDILGEIDGPIVTFNTADVNSTSNESFKKVELEPIINIENNEEIYKIFEENYDFILSKYYINTSDYLFTSEQEFNIFATNGGGDVYGFIGGKGDLKNDKYPIGYVCHEGQCGKIANNLEELLKLIVFYPYWYDLLKCPINKRTKFIKELEKEMEEMKSNYYQRQNTIAKKLGIKRDHNSIKKLFNNLEDKPEFIVFGNDEDNNPYESLLI